jgi:ABC-type multidrug transport system ATPase subunit
MSGLTHGHAEVRDLMEQLKQEGKMQYFSDPHPVGRRRLCDRVAVIHLGELRAVGAVADLTSGVQGKIEIVWQGTTVPASIKALGGECHVTGDTVRAVLSEESQALAVDALRRERLRLVSLVPVRTTLEQYFVEKLKRSEKTAGSMA